MFLKDSTSSRTCIGSGLEFIQIRKGVRDWLF